MTFQRFGFAMLFFLHLAFASNASPSAPGWRTLDDLAEARIGVISGTSQDFYVTKTYPMAQVVRFGSRADQVLSLKTGRVDAIVEESVCMRLILKDSPDLALLEEGLRPADIAAAFRKTDVELRRRFDQFIQEGEADGSLDEVRHRWLKEDSEKAVMPVLATVENGAPLNVGVSLYLGLPFVAVASGQYIGLEIELAQRFAAQKGFSLTFVPLDFDSLIAALASGKIDMIVSDLTVTEERKKAVDFSLPYNREYSSVAVLKKNLPAKTGGSEGGSGWRSLQDLAKGRIAVFSGTVFDGFLTQHYPEAEVVRLNGSADLVLSIKQGRVDAALLDSITGRLILKNNPDLAILDDNILSLPLGVAFHKNRDDLRERFNQFLQKIRANGVYDEMFRRWCIEDAEEAVMPEISLPKGGQQVQIGVAINDLPYVGVANGKYIGFDIELLYRFAADENLDIALTTYEFNAMINALSSGKADLVTDGIAISAERAKAVDFSDPYLEFKTVALAKKSNVYSAALAVGEEEPTVGFWEKLKESYNSNFIIEQRWKLVVNGLWITVVISVLATLFGSMLGAGICALRMSRQPLLRRCGSGYIAVVRGLPVLLMLMLIYYVVFGSVNINPVLVAVIAFGMNFAAYVAEMFRTGIEGVDPGQTEAGIAMGFTRVQTFCRIVLPQATRRILPVYRGEFISMVKMTSVVGYIGVQDLTKAGDIIRSRTFDAFFPLLKVAALYFLVIWVLGLALDYIDRKTDPKFSQRKGARS